MEWESALGSVIEVAISIAGFSGIVAAVGRRGAGHWSKADQLSLRILLTASGMTMLFAFLPFILVDVLDAPLMWRVLSGVLAVWLLGIFFYRRRQIAAAGLRPGIGVRSPYVLAATIAFFAILGANAIFFASSSLYLVGMLWITFIPFFTFVALLLSSWGDAENAPASSDQPDA